MNKSLCIFDTLFNSLNNNVGCTNEAVLSNVKFLNFKGNTFIVNDDNSNDLNTNFVIHDDYFLEKK